MPSRVIFSLTLMIAVLVAPLAPIEISKAFARHPSCCPLIQMEMDPCQRCPLNSSQTNSNSSCCSVQSPCFVYYSNAGDHFVAGMTSMAFKTLTNDRFTVRSERPPVPPPRSEVS